MYNLHCHSLLSDGALLPSEVARRYEACGYSVIAITDHVDYSNIEPTIKAILKFVSHWPKMGIKVLPGIELTHLPLEQFKPLAKYARSKGIKIIVAHGESPVEPVITGTNRAALEADIDILAHPGKISDKDVLLARKNNIFLEVSSRHGHNNTNAHVAQAGLRLNAGLIINTDSHSPQDIITPQALKECALQSGLLQEDILNIYKKVEEFIKRKEK